MGGAQQGRGGGEPVAGINAAPAARRSTEMRSRIGVLIWHPEQAEVWAISVIGRSAGKQGWRFAEGASTRYNDSR
jgi:hypothetical protein